MYLRSSLPGERKKELLKLLPLLIPFLLLFASGLGLTLLQSVGLFTPVPPAFKGFEAYRELLKDPWFLSSLKFSLKTAFFSASVSVVIGTFLARVIWLMPPSSRALAVVYKIPLILPHIVAGFFIQIFFSQSGMISSLLYQTGVISSHSEFPSLLYTESGLGIIAGYIYKEVPFVVLLQLAVYDRMDPRMISAAKNLGAGPLRIFFRIILPQLTPVLNTTFIILFLYSFGAFDLPFIIGGSRPEMLSVMVYNYFFQRELAYRPVAMAALSLMFLFASLFVFFYSKAASRLEKEVRKL